MDPMFAIDGNSDQTGTRIASQYCVEAAGAGAGMSDDEKFGSTF
jgi:hypothetical protein